jgi:putative restriction endonuclease
VYPAFVANAVFTTKVHPAYDDLPEDRYHFPKTLNTVQRASNDGVIYYDPVARAQTIAFAQDRQPYFAIA